MTLFLFKKIQTTNFLFENFYLYLANVYKSNFSYKNKQ